MKERNRQERKQRKAERLVRRKAEKEQEPTPATGGEDPDIAGIVPGPQPLPWEQ